MKWEDLAVEVPKTWVSVSERLLCSADALMHNVSSLSTNVCTSLSVNAMLPTSDTVAKLSSLYAPNSLGLDSLASHVSTLSDPRRLTNAMFGGAESLTQALSVNSVIDSTSAILESTASFANGLRIQTDRLTLGADASIKAFTTSVLAEQPTLSIHSPSTFATTSPLYNLANTIESHVNIFNSLVDTSLATSRINAELFSVPDISATSFMARSVAASMEFTALNNSVYKDYAAVTSFNPRAFLFSAPTIELYSAVRADAVVLGVSDDTLDATCVVESDSWLDALGNELESRLHTVNPELAAVYREGVGAIESGHPGWIRHASVSFRTMFEHLLRQLAPDEAVESYLDDADSYKVEGNLRRAARLTYIFREVNLGSYAKMCEHDIKLAEATFFPSNEVVHRLESPLSDKQMRVLWRRIQGSVSVVLEAAGY